MSCHDNYPFPETNPGVTPGGGPPDPALNFGWSTLDRKLGITESVAFAVKAVKEAKPVWLTIQAFEQRGGPTNWWTMPTESQLRVQAYTAVCVMIPHPPSPSGITYKHGTNAPC